MKKHLKVLLVLFLSFVFIPNVLAKENVSIESVKLDSKSNNTEIINEATYEGLSIKLDLKFNEVDDFAKYKIVINNSTDNDYEISEISYFDDSEYITYEYSYVDNNKIVNNNSKTTMYITIKYNKEVPEELFTDSSFIETNNLVIDLGNNNDVTNTIKNPKTSDNMFIITLVLAITIAISLILYRTTKKKKILIILIINVVLLPISIYAIEKLQIKVESKVEIESQYDYFCYHNDGNGFTGAKQTHIYKKGMTWKEYIESNDTKLINKMNTYPLVNILFPGTDCVSNCRTGLENLDLNNNQIFVTDITSEYYNLPNPNLKIMSSKKICYVFIPN